MVMRPRAATVLMSGIRREVLASAVFTALLVASILLLPSLLLTGSSGQARRWPFLFPSSPSAAEEEQQQYPVRFAYLISASTGDASRAARLLAALYHPANTYLVHLDREAPAEEHRRLADLLSGDGDSGRGGVYARGGNVWIVGRPNLVTYRGPTMLTTTLHAVAVLLRLRRPWDWFINLSASDYPLVTQDDLMEAFAGLPRDLNFIQHTSHLGWKIKKRVRPVILDTALYEDGRAELIRPLNISTNLRSLPTAFKLYTGSAWTMLSRAFAEYVTVGWDDNLPRTLLLYHANLVSSPEFYFQTVACNSRRFRNATVNHDLHFIRWDTPPKQHPLYLTSRDYRRMLLSGAAFARKFRDGDPVLDRIDREVLRRRDPGRHFAYGGWCSAGGGDNGGGALCSNPREEEEHETGSRRGGAVIRPGPGSRRLKAMLRKTLSPRNFRRQQCR